MITVIAREGSMSPKPNPNINLIFGPKIWLIKENVIQELVKMLSQKKCWVKTHTEHTAQ